jgi:hypothetical protein
MSPSANLPLLFWSFFSMVKADRFKRKLSSLLCDGESKRLNDNKFLRKRYRLFQLSRCKACSVREQFCEQIPTILKKGYTDIQEKRSKVEQLIGMILVFHFLKRLFRSVP